MKIVSIEDIAEKVDYGHTASATDKKVGPKFLRITDIKDNVVDWDEVPYCECSEKDFYKNKIEQWDIVFARTGSTGNSFIIKDDVKNTVFASYLIRLRVNSEVADPEFVAYFFQSDNYWKQIKKGSDGTTMPSFNATKLKALKITLPSLSEQKAIVAKLGRAQRLIDIDREVLAKYDELIQSVFLEMFGDPVTNPKGWEIKKLGDVGTLARGKSKHRPRNDPSILGGKYPLIQTGDVSNAGLFITEYESTYNEQGLKQSKLWKKGILCITIAANIAKVGILDFDACFPDSVVGFKSEQASSIFIYSWMGFLQDIIEEQAPVSAQKNINLRILRDLDIIFPPLELQKKYESAVLSIQSEREKVTEMNKKSEELFSSLVQGAFG